MSAGQGETSPAALPMTWADERDAPLSANSKGSSPKQSGLGGSAL